MKTSHHQSKIYSVSEVSYETSEVKKKPEDRFSKVYLEEEKVFPILETFFCGDEKKAKPKKQKQESRTGNVRNMEKTEDGIWL